MIEMSTPVAIFFTLLAACMWGSWMQVVKHTGKYPISGIIFWLYSFSMIFIWVLTLILAPFVLEKNILYYLQGQGEVIFKVLIGGGMMSLGLLLSLELMGKIGLLLSTAVGGAITAILGLATSIGEEGLPSHPMALPVIIACAATFIIAGVVCAQAGAMRDKDRLIAAGKDPKQKVAGAITVNALLIWLLCSFLSNGWSVGTAAGTASGFPPLLTCALMSTGSFISVFIACGIIFTVKHQWKEVLCIGQSKRPLYYSMICALCHYGGNMISIFSMPAISATMSFLFGRFSSVVTYFWGIFYKEFSGSSKKTIAMLVVGLILFFVAVGLLGVFNLAIR